MKKMAILMVTPEVLRDLLQLPKGCEVIRAEVQQGYRGVLGLVIDGAGWDTPEGAVIQPAPAGIATKADGEITIDWGLPQ